MSRTWTARRRRRRGGGGNAAERINNGLLLFPSPERRRCRCRCRRPLSPLLLRAGLGLLLLVGVVVPSSSRHSVSLGSIVALGWAVRGVCALLVVTLPNNRNNNAPRTSFSLFSSSGPSPGTFSARGRGRGGGRSVLVRAGGVAGPNMASDTSVLVAKEEEEEEVEAAAAEAAFPTVERGGRGHRKANDHRKRIDEANDPQEGGGDGGRRSPSSYPSFFVHRTMEFRSTMTTLGKPSNTSSLSSLFWPVQAYRAVSALPATTTTTTTTVPRRNRGAGISVMPGVEADPLRFLLFGNGTAQRSNYNNMNEHPTAGGPSKSKPPPPLSFISKSSVALLDRWESMSQREQHQLRMKIYKEQLASTPLSLDDGGVDGAVGALAILYRDEHLCVCVKPSGVLSVPGPRRNPNLANLVYEHVQPIDIASVDHMVVHRLDMDTSGIVVYALSSKALSTLHADFRSTVVPRRVHKTYVALLHGHVKLGSSCGDGRCTTEVEIDVALERDPNHLPFMRVAQPISEGEETSTAVPGLSSSAMFQHLKHPPKPSLTDVQIVGYEYLQVPTTVDGNIHDGTATTTTRIPVTRVRLTPHTGRTHQLRVHMASVLGHPIVGDDIYGNSWGQGSAADEGAATAPAEDAPTHHDPAPTIGLCLCAQTLCLYHPVTGAQLEFSCVPPF